MGGSNNCRALVDIVHFIIRCSTIGPSASAGMNASAPTITTVPTNSPTNSGVCVGIVPVLAGGRDRAEKTAVEFVQAMYQDVALQLPH